MIRWLPHTAAGTSGAPLSMASRAAPLLPGAGTNDLLIPPSGWMPTISPPRSAPSASPSEALASPSRSTGM